MMPVENYAADELLRDGGSVHVRAIRPDDKERLLEHFAHLSARSVYLRFFGFKPRLAKDELARFTEPDFDRHVGLVATLRDASGEHIIGVGRYFRTAPDRAEVAFAVRDDHQGRGIGTVLLEHLADIGRARGISVLEADVLAQNEQMLDVFRNSGFALQHSLDSGVVHVSFSIEPNERFTRAAEARERHAAAQSIRPILRPRSVAVVGASRRSGSIGANLLANLLREGFKGPIYPVNPCADEIAGLKAYPRVSAIGAHVDLALIAVPAAAVREVTADCARAGVRGVVVISAGFAEVSRSGREAEQELRRLVRGAGMRLVGPNCMGVLNTAPDVSLNATFAEAWPPAGNIGMLSQSGALGLAILDRVRSLNLGISSFVSVGNKADVSSNDMLAYWAQDPATRVIVLYLESFGNPRRFARIAPEVAREKPIVVVKSGRSAAGSRAAASHSAALAGRDVAVDALFEQAGVIRTDTLEDLFDVTALLSTQPIPAGPRVGVITNAGGPAILLADACEAGGLELPPPTEATREALRAVLPAAAALGNPVDMIASAGAEHYARTLEIVGRDESFDAIVVIYIPVTRADEDDIAAAIARGAAAVPAHKPVATVFLSSRGAPPILASGARGKLPAFAFPENCARAIAAALRYGRWRARPRGSVLTLDRAARNEIRCLVDRLLADATDPIWVGPADLTTILRLAGIECAAAEQTTPEAAVAAAERLGYPLVAKAVAPGILHKTEAGGVILGLKSAADVEAAVGALDERIRRAGSRLDGVLLQREVAGGLEALVGVTTDPTFGPLVGCGFGGVFVELVRDVSFRLPPVSDLDAEEMLDRLRTRQLLDGYRGQPAADREALVSLITRVSALAEVVPEMLEFDLNPVKVLAAGHGAVVLDGRMRIQR